MKPPTSRYGCGSDECEACYGDEEYRELSKEDWYLENDPEEYEMVYGMEL